jgi:hypothetical protein
MSILVWAGIAAALMLAAPHVQAADKRDSNAEDWAWSRIRDDEIADFNARCNGQLKPYTRKGWEDPCRQISPDFVMRLLTRREWRDWLQRSRVRLRGAHITGSLNLSDAEIQPELWIDQSRIEGSVYFSDSHWDRLLSLEGTGVTGDLWAWRMRASNNVLLDGNSVFGGSVKLGGAKISGDLVMDHSVFARDVDAASSNVAGDLLMGHAFFAGNVNLLEAKVSGEVGASGASFKKGLNGNRLVVEGSVFLHEGARFDGEVNLVSARVGSNLEMDGSVFAGPVYADNLRVAQNLLIRNRAYFGENLSLIGATVDGVFDMTDSIFNGPVMGDRLRVSGALLMRNGATFHNTVSLISARIGGNLDLRRAVAVAIDLSEADATELLLAGLKWWCPGGKTPNGSPMGSIAGDDELPVFWPLGNEVWPQARCQADNPLDPPKLTLRNFHVSDFQDDSNAWPPGMDLQGFRYDRLGGLGGGGKDDPGKRSGGAWLDWLAREGDFSTQPYTQLSSVLAVAGQHDIADRIQFSARDGERNEACKNPDHQKCAWLSVLSAVAGYGIGSYTFQVLYWVMGFTVLGAVVLCFSANARQHSLLWRGGASLHRLLPIISLAKEFEMFFENPSPQFDEKPNLTRFQVAYFAVHAIIGWALGLVLLAAMSGITQKG